MDWQDLISSQIKLFLKIKTRFWPNSQIKDILRSIHAKFEPIWPVNNGDMAVQSSKVDRQAAVQTRFCYLTNP